MGIKIMENIHTIKLNDYELRIMAKAIELGVLDHPGKFGDKGKDALLTFTDEANKTLGITQ